MQTNSLEVEGYSPVCDLLRSTSALSIPTLDLSRRDIKRLPDDFPLLPRLECLYLEGNSLQTLPDYLFIKCPSLRWLDLRNNALTTIPHAIQNLRCLKTLLLEGNCITSLPPHLGTLHKLNGLSLSGNPLQCPPPHVVRKGTKAVLQYLRKLIDDEEEDNNSGESSEEDNGEQIHLKPLATRRNWMYSPDELLHAQDTKGLSMKQLTLHTSLKQQKRKQEQFAGLLSSLDNHKKNRRVKTQNERDKPNKKVKQQNVLDPQEKERISEILEREKSKQCLDDWRDETKRIQKETKQDVEYSHASEVAPFATQNQKQDTHEISKDELDKRTDSGQESDQGVITEWMKDYAKQIQQTRENGGLMSHPVSNELLNAELKLAEALALRRKFETDKTRQYRLRAFTGDILF